MDLVESHYRIVLKALAEGKIVPFLGAGFNLCGRPKDFKWNPNQQEYLPSGGELAQHFADEWSYPGPSKTDLLRVAQYVDVMSGSADLTGALHKIFSAKYPCTAAHAFLATLPRILREAGRQPRLLIVTTNYDDLMERAFGAAEEPFDLVTYVAEGINRGRFLHTPPGEPSRPIETPNDYRGISLERPALMKIHGSITHRDNEQESFVITEDHYIDYLTRTTLSDLVPVNLLAALRTSHFLFLGYGLADWNFRVILRRIYEDRAQGKYRSWAIQHPPDELECRFWSKRDVEILDRSIDDYISTLRQRLVSYLEATQSCPTGPASGAV
jgi:hypothetical protein